MTLTQRLRRLDEHVAERRNGRWFLAGIALMLLVVLAMAAATDGLTRLAAGLVTPAAVAVGVVLGVRWTHRR